MVFSPTLSTEEIELFYDLWFPLMEFTNRKYKIDKSGTHYKKGEQIDLSKALQVSNYLWEHPSCIEEYLKQAKISKANKEIIRSWKRNVRGTFIIERHLKKGSVFISKDHQVFLVKGLFSPFEELFPDLPVPIEATLLPFNDTIITNGLFNSFGVSFGSEVRRDAKEIYLRAKENGTIKTTL